MYQFCEYGLIPLSTQSDSSSFDQSDSNFFDQSYSIPTSIFLNPCKKIEMLFSKLFYTTLNTLTMTPEVYTMYYWMFDFDANDFIEYDEAQREEIDTMHVKSFGHSFPEMWVYSYVNPRFCMSYEDLVLYGNNMFNIHSMFPAIGKFNYNNYCALVFEQEEQELECNEYDEDVYYIEEPAEYEQTEEEESIYHLPSGLLDDEVEPHYYLPSGLLDDEEESHYYLPSYMFDSIETQCYAANLNSNNLNNQLYTSVPVKGKTIYSQPTVQESYYNGCVSF